MTSDQNTGYSSTAGRLAGAILALTLPWSTPHAVQAQKPDWLKELSLVDKVPEGSVTMTAPGYGAETLEHLERVGLDFRSIPRAEVTVHGTDAFHGVLNAKADWATYRLELNGKFASRQSTEVLGQAMTVTSVISPEGLRISDDRGGSRTETYRRFPRRACDREGTGGGCVDPEGLFHATFDEATDEHGTIVEFVRNRQGSPTAVRFGESLLLRYRFTPPLPARVGSEEIGREWREPVSWDLVDLRTSEIVIDSVDASRAAFERAVSSVYLQGAGEVLRFEDGEAFAVARGVWWQPYALMPLETGSEIWRIVHAIGGRSRDRNYRVDYTAERVRVRMTIGEGERSIVLEAPRSRERRAPIAFVHPGAERLPEAMRSGVWLRASDPVGSVRSDAFEKERFPIVLRPFHLDGIVPVVVRYGLLEVNVGSEATAATVRAVSGAEAQMQFGPADGCEVEADRVVCTGGASEVIGAEEPTVLW